MINNVYWEPPTSGELSAAWLTVGLASVGLAVLYATTVCDPGYVPRGDGAVAAAAQAFGVWDKASISAKRTDSKSHDDKVRACSDSPSAAGGSDIHPSRRTVSLMLAFPDVLKNGLCLPCSYGRALMTESGCRAGFPGQR